MIKNIDLIQKTLDYIDEHIMEKIDIHKLVDISGFSIYHYYKIFKEFIGLPVMEYVTKRKLQFSLYDLAKGDKVLDIALNYGFETHAGFTKAFKKYFGYSPNYYRIHAPIDSPPRVMLQQIADHKIGGIIEQPKIIQKDSFKVIGYSFKTTLKNQTHSRDIPAYWDKCNIEGKEEHLYGTQHPLKHGEYGFCVQNHTEDDEFSYVLGIEVENFNKMLDNMFKLEVPSATYAVFTSPKVVDQDFVKSIQGTWKFILEDWFPNSKYEIDDHKLDFEFYDNRCHPWEYDKLCMEIYIPITLKCDN